MSCYSNERTDTYISKSCIIIYDGKENIYTGNQFIQINQIAFIAILEIFILKETINLKVVNNNFSRIWDGAKRKVSNHFLVRTLISSLSVT